MQTAGTKLSAMYAQVVASRPTRPRSSDPRIRGALLLPLCALIVHQLRYLLVFEGSASQRLARDGHAYLASVEPFALLATTLALGLFIGRLAQVWQTGLNATARGRPTVRIWAVCAVSLLAIYCGQELLEGMFAAGHPSGLAGVVGHGGWIAVPVAAAVAGLLTFTLKLAEAVLRRAAGHNAKHHQTAAIAAPARGARSDWRRDPQRGVVAGRAPPKAAATA